MQTTTHETAVPALLTVKESAAALRCSEATIWRKIRDGELAVKRLGAAHGSGVRIPVVELRRLLDGGR